MHIALSHTTNRFPIMAVSATVVVAFTHLWDCDGLCKYSISFRDCVIKRMLTENHLLMEAKLHLVVLVVSLGECTCAWAMIFLSPIESFLPGCLPASLSLKSMSCKDSAVILEFCVDFVGKKWSVSYTSVVSNSYRVVLIQMTSRWHMITNSLFWNLFRGSLRTMIRLERSASLVRYWL